MARTDSRAYCTTLVYLTCRLPSLPFSVVASTIPLGRLISLPVAARTTQVQLWDVSSMRKLRTMRGHAARVGAMDWNAHVLSSGSRDGSIHHHDVRVRDHHIGTLAGHDQEVCTCTYTCTCTCRHSAALH